ncbi:S26 family signal peptidase [Salinibacterium sp.]|uniref:S26 family signal peptidase n=1 Tax=Salinibacterium sp. TaxID=1915057 RepID=UPI00286C5B15|nr:S26 family signal peptidase [Salinibacterium sp.]
MTTTTTPRGARARTIALWSWGALAAAAVIIAAIFWISGGRWFIVESPSMGQAAPVGTLVLSTPVSIDTLSVGDIITFIPPATTEVYTHRIVKVDSDGLTTQGDINGATDPWVLGQPDIIGQATRVLPGVGWLLRSIPFLVIGGTVVWFLSGFLRTALRRSVARILGFSLVAAVTAFILRPFVGVAILELVTTQSGAEATVVSTGLMPIRVQAIGGTFVDLVSGQVGQLNIPGLLDNGSYQLGSTLNLSLLGWILFGLACATPLLWCLIVGLPPSDEKEERTL